MKPLWSQFARQCNSRPSSCIHMVLYTFDKEHIIGQDFHDIGIFLFCQSGYWRHLIIENYERPTANSFLRKAIEEEIGSIKISMDSETLYGYDRNYDMKSHFLVMALTVLRSALYARMPSVIRKFNASHEVSYIYLRPGSCFALFGKT